MSAKKKTISRVLCLVMIVALIVPALLVLPASAAVDLYSYNGYELPGLPAVSWDNKYMLLQYDDSMSPEFFTAVLYYSSIPFYSLNSEPDRHFQTDGEPHYYAQFSCYWGTDPEFDSSPILWEKDFDYYSSTKVSEHIYDAVWSNVNIYKENGSLLLAGSLPVPVGGSNYPNSAETPTFTKNLTGATFYYMQGSTPEPLTVEAMVSDGGELSYEWFRSDDVYQEALCTSNIFYPPTDTPGTVSYACKVTNRQYNPNADSGYFSSTAYSFSDTISVVASSTDPTTPEETTPDYSGKFDDLQNSMDEMPDKITDGMQDIMEQEKEQATQQGGQFVDDITGVVPNDSQGFIDALGSLVSVLSYDGTECVLPIPALTLPAIGGLFPSYTVMEAQEVDFEEFFAMMPPAIMLLVQSLLTVALIVYCFKELYDTVAYFFVLKGGNK